jgi:hypothetical protein
MRTLHLCVLLLAALLSGCSTLVPAPAGPSPSAAVANAAWAQVLQRFVNDQGEVDFPALAAAPRDLDSYVRHVADTPLDALPDGPARLAHMINAYNALSMFNVLRSGIPATHAGFNKVTFFVFRTLEIGGQRLSLRSFENDVIRPYALRSKDPRIHFALNCSALACPVLPRTPFTAAGLDAELERETRAFFARPANFRVDSTTSTLWLSELLDFYPEDFVPAVSPSLLAYANRYAPQPAPPGYQTRFTPYDWTIANSQRPR